MKPTTLVAATLVLAVLSTGCRTRETREQKAERAKQAQVDQKAALPADSPLRKIEYGMTEDQVVAILGSPSRTGSHTTGKQFIPFNFAAKDTMRMTYFYDGLGRIQFSFGSWGQRNGVVDIAHDPSQKAPQ